MIWESLTVYPLLPFLDSAFFYVLRVIVKYRFTGILRKCNCPLFEKTRILPSLDAFNIFLRSLDGNIIAIMT